MKKLPINKTVLREIVDGNCCYVDKTYYIIKVSQMKIRISIFNNLLNNE